MMEQAAHPRFASGGSAYVYVLPCGDEDLLKVGFSREPLRRFHTLHRRFYDFFDLDRGLLIGVDRVVQARRIERTFIETWQDQRAPAPLVIPRAAAGHTEWYRGIYAQIRELATELARRDGHALYQPLRPWLIEQLFADADRLFDWSTRMLDAIEYASFNHGGEAAEASYRRALLDTLQLYQGVGLPARELVPDAVWDWFEQGVHRLIFQGG